MVVRSFWDLFSHLGGSAIIGISHQITPWIPTHHLVCSLDGELIVDFGSEAFSISWITRRLTKAILNGKRLSNRFQFKNVIFLKLWIFRFITKSGRISNKCRNQINCRLPPVSNPMCRCHLVHQVQSSNQMFLILFKCGEKFLRHRFRIWNVKLS